MKIILEKNKTRIIGRILILIIAIVVMLAVVQGVGLNNVRAASSGPNSPGTMATDGDSGGSKDWTLPDYAKVEDGNSAFATVGFINSPPPEPPEPCLAPDTLISTKEGNKAIKDLREGDLVYSYNPASGENELKEVSNVISAPISRAGNKYYHIYFESGNIKATYNHFFYVDEKLVMAKDLKIGDELLALNGKKQPITKIVIEENYTDDVWDISVNDNHNFFANGILVHNASAVYDHRVRIIKGGTIGSTDKASGTAWPTSLAYTTYGSSSDLWGGEPWTAEDINASNFGVAISAYGSGFDSNYTTYYLQATNFGFSIPDGSTINGITVEIKKSRYPPVDWAGNSYAWIDHIRITVDYTADVTSPTVSSVAVQTGSTVNVVFSEAMGTGVTTAANYTVSGTGQGTLANNPTSAALVSGSTYILTWSSGEMKNAGDITVTVANAQDLAGNPIGSPNSGTHTSGGIGVAPTVSITSPTTGTKVNASKVITFTDDETTSPQCSIDDTNWTACTSDTTTLGSISQFAGITEGDTFTLYLKDTDAAGNIGTNNVANLTKDTTAPTFTMQYYSDSDLTATITDNSKLKAGTYYVKISASEALGSTPTVSIAAEGTANDVTNGATALVSGNDYKYTRTISADAAAVGSVIEDWSVTGTDSATNTATNVNPTNEAAKAMYTDTTAPAVSTLSPVDNAPAVAVDSNLVITFSEAVDAEAGANNDIVIKKTSDNSTIETIDSQDAKVTGSGTATITINPAATLSGETSYYVQIGADAFDDAASNSYAGIADTTTWNFTTADVTNPTVSTLSPADNAPAVAVDSNLVITFSEAVDAETGNINLYKTAGDVLVQAFNVTTDITGTGTNTITANPTSNLLGETAYYVKIDATAFDDASSNSYAGIADATTWNFTSADIANPTISGGLPSGEQSAGTTNITMSVTTDENATCKYSSTSGTGFALMTAFTTTDTTSHSTSISGLSNGSSYSYYVLCQDSSNNESTETTISFSVASAVVSGGGGGMPVAWNNPPVAPTGGFDVSINNGTAYTDALTVILNLRGGSDTARMAISNFADFRDAGQETYSATKEWNLCQGKNACDEGDYSVYVKFYASWGRSSEIVSDSIIYRKAKSIIEEIKEIPKKIIEGVKKIPEIFKPKPAETNPPEVPIEELVPKEAPLAFQGKWQLLPREPIREFVLAPLPKEIRALAEKFPELGETLEKVGITKITDIEKLKAVKLTLPGLTEKVGLPKGVPVAELSPKIKQLIPSEIVFAKTAGGLIDFNISLIITEKGQPQQKITTISGKSLQLVVKPEKPVKSVKGYVVFRSKPQKAELEIPQSSLLASLIFSYPVFAANHNPAEIETRLVLLEFEYTDPDNDGIYTAEIQAPQVEGEYEIITVMDFEDPALGAKEIRLITVVDPEGYVYRTESDGLKTRISGAIISLFWLNPEIKQYELWPAKEYQQENPQITDDTGKYSFLVPPGIYYLKVEAPKYPAYQSDTFSVKEGSGIHMNIELKSKQWWLRILSWEKILLIFLTIIVFTLAFFLLYNFYRDKIREKLMRKS